MLRAGEKEQELRAFASTRLLNDGMEPIRGCGEGDGVFCWRIWRGGSSVRTTPNVAGRDPGRDPEMGDGMADYVTAEWRRGRKIRRRTTYCHNVAGLVGEGLTGIFVGREYESRSIERQ